MRRDEIEDNVKISNKKNFERRKKRYLNQFIFIILITCSAIAEVPKVKKGEYLIFNRKNLSALTEDSTVNVLNREYVLKKPLGLSSFLVKDKNSPIGLNDETVIEYNPKDDTCRRWKEQGIAEYCSPNFIVTTKALPDDNEYLKQWALNGAFGIDAEAAWDINQGNDSVVIAVVDTGVDYHHPELSRNIWTNPFEVPGNGIDDDENGYIDDIHGINAITGSGNPMDDNIHGTHVSGIIGAIGNNSNGVVGVNWKTKIMGLKFLDSSGFGGMDSAVIALNYMVKMKKAGVNIRVVNNSWGGAGFSEVLEQAVKQVRDSGIIFVAAAGNEANDNDINPIYPASHDVDNVVSVAATDINGNITGFSNYGLLKVNIAAPGQDILSTIPNSKYASLSGTSMAAPFVTGALGLLLSKYPEIGYQQAITRLYESGRDLQTLNGLINTGRLLNLSKLLRGETSPVPKVNVEDPCQYDSSEIPFIGAFPEFNSEPVLQTDELQYKVVRLPFSFPFFDKEYLTITVSPNGMIYFGAEPQGMDFQIKDKSPHASTFASIFTDFNTEKNPYGIWVKKESNRVYILWYAIKDDFESLGRIKAMAILNSTGELESHIAFSNEDIKSEVLKNYVVGVRSNSKYSTTKFDLANFGNLNYGISFKSKCHKDRFQLRNLVVKGTFKNKESSKYATPKRPIRIDINGSGKGYVQVGAKIGKQNCPYSKSLVTKDDGTLNLNAILPSIPKNVANIKLSVQNFVKQLAIPSSTTSKSSRSRFQSSRVVSKKSNLKISTRKLNNTCEKLFASFLER